jgi:hypothetical protein
VMAWVGDGVGENDREDGPCLLSLTHTLLVGSESVYLSNLINLQYKPFYCKFW